MLNSPEQHFEPEKVLFSGGGATQAENNQSKSDAEVAKWNFHSHYHQVVHRDEVKCTICRAFLRHCGDGVIDSPISYNEASAERRRFFTQNSELQSKTTELEARIDTKQAEYHSLWHQYKAKCRDLEDLERKHGHLLADFKYVRDELDQTREQLNKLTDNPERNGPGKRRRVDPPVVSSNTANPDQSTAMVIDDQDGPAKGTSAIHTPSSTLYPPWDDGLYRASKDFELAQSASEKGLPIPVIGVNGKPLPPRWVPPTTKSEVEQCYVRLKNSVDKGKGSYSLWVFLNRLAKAAKAVPENQRDEVQAAFVSAHYVPDFVTERWNLRDSKSANIHINSKSDVPAPGTSATSKPSNSAPAKGPKQLSQPPKHAPVSAYAAWGLSASARGKTPMGMKSYPDGSISMRSVRGFHLFYQFSPVHKSGLPAQFRYKYHFTFAELALTRNTYRNYIAENPLPNSIPASPTPHPGEFNNITPESLAEFLRNQGVSVTQLEDAAYYAALWLSTLEPTNVHAVHDRNELRQRVLPSLVIHGIPAGLDDDLYHPDGRIEKRPPTAITDVPGAAPAPSTSPSNSTVVNSSASTVASESAPDPMTTSSPSLPIPPDTDTTMTDSAATTENGGTQHGRNVEVA
ncbi:hypothetical protein PQX77_022164 [Marasmius sp. AFHP31]|nr:hypothetical protein PQX77_022164 [Marasmius sp. AFHP31]